MTPILSICIPTYNRAIYLKTALDSIVTNSIFKDTDKIEIVISDNFSTDNTEELVSEYLDKYKGKIHYLKNEQTLPAMKNFYNVLTAAHGKYLKLCNDTCAFTEDSLNYILSTIEENINEKPVLFFANGSLMDSEIENLNDFVKTVSYLSTWSGSFGIWEEDRHFLNQFLNLSESQIAQTHILCEMIKNGKKFLLKNNTIFNVVVPTKKGGYNVAEVFGKNYLNILKNFIRNGELSKSVYENEKKKLLINHINIYYFDINKQFSFDKNGYFKYLWNDYKKCPYFYITYIQINLSKIISNIFSIKKISTEGHKRKVIIILGIKIQI